jgi:hypothetical protein
MAPEDLEMPVAGEFGPAPTDIAELRAPRVGPEYDELVDHCKTAIRHGALHYVAYFVRGNCRFAVDVVDGNDLEPDFLLEGHSGGRRGELLRSGQQLNFIVSRLDKAVEAVRSGRLIRTVFNVTSGALYYFSVVPGEYLIGATFDTSMVLHADESMGWLVDRTRTAMGWGGAANPGGFLTEHEVPAPDQFRTQLPPYVVNKGDEPDEIAGPCSLVLNPENVHYIAFFRDAECTFTADILRHEGLNPYFVGIGREERRSVYQRIGKLLYLVTGQLDHSLAQLLGGQLVRTVLDVEAGALYYMRISDREFLVGVTMDQSRVAVADRQLAELALTLQNR